MRRFAATAAALLFSGLLICACRGRAKVVDACANDETTCLPCTSDEECRFGGNACTETVYCAHRDAVILTVEIGCDEALEYSWPDDDECQCQGTCKPLHEG